MPTSNMHKRHTGIYDPANHKDAHVIIVGCGNIGSHVAMAVARMGVPRITLIDADEVEEHNLASQAYTLADIGAKKVTALAAHIATVSHAQVTALDAWYSADVIRSVKYSRAIVISAVDSIDVRKDIANTLPEDITGIIDGRMGGAQMEVYAFKTGAEWTRTLDVVADADACSARYISYTACIIAGLITNNVKRMLLGEDVKACIMYHADTSQIFTPTYDTNTNA